jgi:hypothetical protein
VDVILESLTPSCEGRREGEKAKKPRLRGCERLRAAEEEELAEGTAGTVLYAVATFRYRSDIAAKFSCRVTADQQLAINQSHLSHEFWRPERSGL